MGRMSDIDKDFFEQETDCTSNEVQAEENVAGDAIQQTQPTEPSATKLELPSLSSQASLINLQITTWTANKKDTVASEKLMAESGAVDKSVRVYKSLLPSCTAHIELTKHVTNFRKKHLELTLPWADRGDRLIPGGSYISYYKELHAFGEKFEELKTKLSEQYYEGIEQAREDCGDLFDIDDYLSLPDVLDKFTWGYEPKNIPENDFRNIDNNDEANDFINNMNQKKAKEAATRRADSIRDDLYLRLLEPLTNVLIQLDESNFDGTRLGYNDKGEPVNANYKESLIPNVNAVTKLMREWVVDVSNTGDASGMSTVVNYLQSLSGVNSMMLKHDTVLRRQVVATCTKAIRSIPAEPLRIALKKEYLSRHKRKNKDNRLETLLTQTLNHLGASIPVRNTGV